METIVKNPRQKKTETTEDLLKAIRERRPDKLFSVGKTLLGRDCSREALSALELAHQASPTEPLYMSYLGLAAAHVRSKDHDSVDLCERAARQEFYKAELLHNLGRVYLLRGQLSKARETFSRGVEIDSSYFPNLLWIEKMGVRSKPVFGFIRRNHPINRLAGKTLNRLGLRV